MIDKKDLSPIGIGAWGIGGFAERNPKNNDEKQIEALLHSLKKGMNFVEINFWNSQGKSVELIARAIKESKIARDKLFYCLVIYNYNLPTIEDVKREMDFYYELFGTDYIDSLEFTMTTFKAYGFDSVVKLADECISNRKSRFTSLTNCNLEYLKRYHNIFKNKLFSHELHYSFEIRDNEDAGITGYGLDNDILNVIYQPLRRNRTVNRNWPLLGELSQKYGKTQNQIILNWLNWKGFKPLVKSETVAHIDENLASFGFKLSRDDYERLDAFRIPGYRKPNIDWWQKGKFGDKVHMLPNVIDDIIEGKYEYRK